jgi:mRNA interferase RelE/StbE
MQLIISSQAQRDLRLLSREVGVRVSEALDSLVDNPHPPGCRLLINVHPPTWRTRVGSWRILYQIDEAAGDIIVVRVRHRSQVYRAL